MTILKKRNLNEEKYGDLTKNHAKCSVLTIPREKHMVCFVLKHPYMSMGRYTGIFDDSQTAN